MGRLIPMSRGHRAMALCVVLMVVAVLATSSVFRIRAEASLASTRALAAEADDLASIGHDLVTALMEEGFDAQAYRMRHAPAQMLGYTTARVRVAASLARLQRAAQAFPGLAEDQAAVAGLVAARSARLDHGLLDAEQAEALPAGGAPATMATVRSAIERLIEHAQDEEVRRAAAEDARAQTVMQVVTLAAAAGVLLLGAATLALLAGRDRLLRAQRALRAQSSLWQATVENLQDGVAVFDGKGALMQWNRALAPLTGFPPDVLQEGTPFARFVQAAGHWEPPALSEGMPPPVWDGVRGGVQPAVEVRANGRVLEVCRNAMPGGGQMITIGDVTRRVEAEAIVRQAQKMEVLGQLTGGVAHDFNNLLQVVSANLELLAGALEGEGEAAEWRRSRVLAAMEGVGRGARLTRHLLAFARQQPLTPEPVDAARLLAGLEDMLRRTLGPTITLEHAVEPGLWTLCADALQLENALLNLAINGRDAMAGTPPEHARLTIEARNVVLDDAYCADNPPALPGEYVMLAVTDCGCGMTAEQLARAVEPFYTTKAAGQGTGLGLPMAHGFARQSGGHLKVHSQPGYGTTARIYIPRTHAAVPEASHPAQPLPGGEGERVLLVEDDEGVRSAAALALRGLGYQVHEAADAGAALAAIEAGHRPDLLLTDVMLPGPLSARALAAQARARLPALAVLFTSGYADASAAPPPGMDSDILRKPWRLEELAARIRRALQLPHPASRLRILLVEDEPLVRELTAEALQDLGHDVVAVEGADAALHHVHAVDLMVTDVALAGMDGLALAIEARRLVPGLPVIAASGQERPEHGAEGMLWLAKPYDAAALAAAVASISARRLLEAGAVPRG